MPKARKYQGKASWISGPTSLDAKKAQSRQCRDEPPQSQCDYELIRVAGLIQLLAETNLWLLGHSVLLKCLH